MRLPEPCVCEEPASAVPDDAAPHLAALRDHLVGALEALDCLFGSAGSELAWMPGRSVHGDVQVAAEEELDGPESHPGRAPDQLLLGAGEVAQRLGMSARTFRRFRNQHPGFPRPRIKRATPRWRASDIEAWVEGRR